MSEFLEIANIPEGETFFEFVWSPMQLGLQDTAYPFTTEIKFDFTCNRHGLEISCYGFATTDVELVCVRCLEKFGLAIREPIDFVIRLMQNAAVQVELWQEDTVTVNRLGGKINLKPRVHDAIILGIPQFPVCDDNCRGLCQVCGANLNEEKCAHSQEKPRDSRMEKLQEYLDLIKGKKTKQE